MADQPSYTLKYDISRQIKDADGTVRDDLIRPAGTSLPLTRPKGKVIKAANKIADDVEKSFFMISRVTGLSIADVDEMDMADINGIGDMLESFTEDGRETGNDA